MERRRAAGALLALATCILCTAAAPTASNHTALDLYDGEPAGCYYNFQHYGEGDRIMTNEPCLNCTCHNRMLMCYLRVCPFTKPIGQDCTVEKRADQCCPIVTCPDVPVDLLTLTSTTSPAEYGATGVGKLDKYGCSIHGKYFPEGSKVPPTPNKPCEHCYCIRNMTTCVMQECTLHVDGCTPIYLKDVCCPVRYSCDHLEDEILLLDDKTTTVRPTPGFLLTTTTNSPVTQFTQDCVHDDQIFSDGALIKTEKACEHCYCMKGDIVCVVQECGTPMENEGKNCTSLPPREGQCCPDTYICEGDELNTELPVDLTTKFLTEDLTTLSPPRRVGVEGSGYRKEPDNIAFVEPHLTEPTHEGSGDSNESEQAIDLNEVVPTEDSTKYIHSTVPSIENIVKEDSEKATSEQPSAEIPSSTDIESEDNVKATTISDKEQEVTHEDAAGLDKTEITSNIPSYDHKLETSQPEVQSVTESEIVIHDDKITLATIASDLEKATTVKPKEENVVTDAEVIQHDKYLTTTVVPILEDEGITTELDREQQMISAGPIEEHSYEPGLHTASTTSAPFLEEVEGIPTGTYGQNVVSDGITESNIYDSTKDKAEAITTPAVGDNDNLIVEVTKIPEMGSHELAVSTTNAPISEEVEKTSTAFPVDLVTSKSSEETYEGDKLISTSTHLPIAVENEEAITENLKESPATTQIPESLDSEKIDDETQKYQTEKYDQVTDQNTYSDYADASTKPSASVIDQKEDEVTKSSEEPVTDSNYGLGSEISDADKQVTPSSAPMDNVNLSTIDDKDINKPQVQDSVGSTKPAYIDDSERVTTQETSYDISTEKNIEQEKSQTSSTTSAPITEEIEMATTEFIRDQDFVTTAIMEQESIKPGEYAPSTSSTPFLEEIEKQTTEVSQGHVVTDVIAEKDIKPSKHVPYTTESPLETEYITTAEPDKGLNTIPSGTAEEAESSETPAYEKTTQSPLKEKDVPHPQKETIHDADIATTIAFSLPDGSILKEDKNVATTEPSSRKEDEHRVEPESTKIPELVTEISVESTPATETFDHQETKSPPKPSYDASHDILGTVPPQELTTETSRTEENTSEKEIKPDVEVVTLSTQITPTLPEITTINLGENEIVEDNVLPPGRIPGEGDCLLNGITYKNESVVPSTNKCHSDCRCVSSIIKCSPIICSSPPEYMDNCQPTYDSPESCCPTYVCDQFRETLPPMPHIQITTELPQQPSSIECRGDQCNIEEHKIQPTVSTELCANNDCGSEIDKKTDISSCGPHGCIESHTTPELCTDGKCTQTSETSEECANGDCKHLPATDVQCEGENCESSVVNIPFAPECENGICKDKVPDLIPVSVPCTEEDGCKGTEVNVAQDCADETCRRIETLDIHAKPTSCNEPNCDQTPIQVAIETSTLGETSEIKTESPEINYDDISTEIDRHIDYVSTEAAIYQTTVLEKLDYATEINDYGTTISFETTQQTDKTSELRPHKESSFSVTQEEPKMTESSYTDKESVTETHTKSPVLDSENDVLSTKIPEEYITDSHQIDIESPDILTEKQPIFETSESDDSKHTEPTQHVPDAEEQTISVLLPDAEIPTKQPELYFTTEPAEVLATTSEPKVSDSEKYNTKQPEHSITEVMEAEIIDSHKHTSLPDISIAEHEQYTQEPMYTIPKSEDTTVQPAVEVSQEITTEDQSETVSEYQSGPKSTTLTPTDIYVTLKESDEKVTESEIQTGDVEMYTEPHITPTSSQAISIESSTQENTEVYFPGITLTSEEYALPTEPSRTSDKVTDVTEESFISTESDKIQKPEKEHVTGNELLEASITGIAEPTTEPSIKDHELNTENGLHVSLPEEEITTEGQKKTDLESTPPPIVGTDDATEDILHEKEVTESSSSAPHNIGEEIHATTVAQDVSAETSEFSTTTDLYRITEKPHNIEQESTETTSEKSEIPFHDTEQDTDDSIEPVTMPDRTTKLPEILSHSKDHSTESPIATESQTDKFNEVQYNTVTTRQEEPSTEKTLNVVTAESEDQTGKPGTLTEESQPPTIKDEATVSNIEKDKIETPVVVPQEISTEDIYTSDLEKSTEHVESFTTRPESQTSEVFMTDKAETTTVLTLTEKETESGLPDMIPVTDEYDGDINVQKVEASTEKELSEYTSPQSYAPEKQEPEHSYTEKAQTVLSDSTTKTIEAYTTEQSQVLIDTSTSPEIDQVVTGKVPNIKEEEGPEIHETTEITVIDITKADEMFTEPPEKYNIEEDTGTKIQEDVTQQQEFVTDMPEIHASTSSDQYSKAPELIPDTFVTEPQDTSEVSDGVQVTELQTPVTELEHLLTTKQPEIEEPVKESESPLSTDITPSTIKILTTQDEHAVTPGLIATTEETLSTDLEDITSSSVGLQQSLETESDTVVVTESSHKATTLPESLSSIKSEEASTSLPDLDYTEHGGIQTIASEPLTEEPTKITSQIPDSEKIDQEDTATKTSEPIGNVDNITQYDHESHTIPQESATEIMGTELSTEPTLQNASDSHDKDELSEPTSVPVYELPETTPYLIELQEHTHKTIEITTSSPSEGEITTEQIVSVGIKHEHTVPETVTDATIDKEAEVQKPTKQYQETSTYEDISEKTTQPTISKDEESLQTTGDIDIKDATIYKEQDFTTRMPTKVTEMEKESTPESPITDNVEKIITTSEKPIQSDLTVKITTPEETNIQSTEKTITTIGEESPTQPPVAADKITKPEEKPIELSSPSPDLSKPVPSEIQPTDEVPSPDEEAHFPPSGSSAYGNEPDYVEEDQAFGPGTCRYGGKVYVSAQQIPRDDPCDFCFCFRSDIICLQQSCPPPIHGCHEEPIQGFCCPRYECPVSMATTLNVTTTTTTTTTTLPPHFPTHSYKGAAQRRGCQIKGHTYKVGEVVRGSSGPCLHCTCGGDGQMKCDPKACTPEPMLRQMIAAAVSAKRRR